ncbi:HAD hydrolase-like protein [Rhodobacterales bacterium HKCCE2091]|nr:HAD hydrolase-like protein [Rhodobacterales bacterium HKCCE2091]
MSARPFDLVVFDFDGTLVLSNAVKANGFNRIAEQFEGGPAAMEQALAEPGLDRHTVARRFAETLRLPPDAAPKIAKAYGDLVNSAVVEVPEAPGASDLIEALRGALVAVHVSSATPRDALVDILNDRGWSMRFDGVHGRPATKVETLEALIAATRTPPARIAVVGDGPDDGASAEAVGAAFFAVGDRLPGARPLAEVRGELLP